MQHWGEASPRLFNHYVNQIIFGLGSANVGCPVDRLCVNNINYADDIVLLSSLAGALRKLLRICESYVMANGFRYNSK